MVTKVFVEKKDSKGINIHVKDTHFNAISLLVNKGYSLK